MQSLQLSPEGVLLGLILVSAWGVLFLLYQIIKQQGRLLLRLDGIEQHLGILAPAMPAGLDVGKLFPAFKLPDLDGKEVALEAFRGRRILLVNWSPQCGFCVRIAPVLAQLQPAFQAHNVLLALASYGDAGANRKLAGEHGLTGLFLLQKDAAGIEAFQRWGTPVAYLLDEKGRVVKPLAVGADQVPVLARYAVGKATEAELDVSSNKGICRQGADKKNAPQELEIEGAGPGTELKKLLAKIGIAVTPDCPCAAHAALMDQNGCEWCEQNLATITGWMREESERRGVIFIEKAARFLAKRAIAKARRREEETNNRSGEIIRTGERVS
jgi:peroxiredoxin